MMAVRVATRILILTSMSLYLHCDALVCRRTTESAMTDGRTRPLWTSTATALCTVTWAPTVQTVGLGHRQGPCHGGAWGWGGCRFAATVTWAPTVHMCRMWPLEADWSGVMVDQLGKVGGSGHGLHHCELSGCFGGFCVFRLLGNLDVVKS